MCIYNQPKKNTKKNCATPQCLEGRSMKLVTQVDYVYM